MPPDLLPDCRLARSDKTVNVGVFGNMVQVFCGFCHTPGGLVFDTSTFAFWMCNDCFAASGELTLGYVMPDEVFYQKMYEEQLAMANRPLTIPELDMVIREDCTPLAQLIKEQPRPR